MTDFAKELTPITIEDELKQSYLDYAMSVIVGRALPDVRDGLKPVHRRVLYAMDELSNHWNKAYKKSARVVGDVIGKYHPHGDGPVYDTLVRMAQPFAMRYPLVDGQGNFGSIDGDAPAAMRYTEVRLQKLTQSLLNDLSKNTVDFVPNYDGTETAPAVLPARIPNLLVNGSAGIAVGMATNIPPHNLNEVIHACIALIDAPDSSIETLMQHMPGPDFPTAGIIHGRAGILQAYQTGRGRIYVRARMHIEDGKDQQRTAIVITELPYQVNKARLIEKIAELVKDKKIEGIAHLRDESDQEGMRVVIELKRGELPEILMNKLYAQTALQSVFGINMVALQAGQPKLFNLKELLEAFIAHRREVVTRRTLFDLAQTRHKAHVLEGLAIAISNIDDMIALIKASQNPQAAREALQAQRWPGALVSEMLSLVDDTAARPDDLPEHCGLSKEGYQLSAIQAQAILDLKLHRLTGLERDKIMADFQACIDLIANLLKILNHPEELMRVIREELLEIQSDFADTRRTEIIESQHDLTAEDLIPNLDCVITLSHAGYAKSQLLEHYQAQKRGGRGRSATQVKEEDVIDHLLIAKAHDTLLCFSSLGKLYWLKAYRVPQASRAAKGRPIINLLPLAKEETITAILPVSEFSDTHFVVLATASATIKKVKLSDFSRPRQNGIIAIQMKEGDQLVGAALTDGKQEIMLFSNAGKAIRFEEDQVRCMGRLANGVRGMRLKEDQQLIALVIPTPEHKILTASEHGYGKCTPLDAYRMTQRGGQGVMSIQVNERNGNTVSACAVQEDDELMLMTNKGMVVRTRVLEISTVGRNAQGVRLMNLSESESLVALKPVQSLGPLDEDTDEPEEASDA